MKILVTPEIAALSEQYKAARAAGDTARAAWIKRDAMRIVGTVPPPVDPLAELCKADVVFNAATSDYDVSVNGEFIGVAPTFAQGEWMARDHVYDLLQRGIIGDARLHMDDAQEVA